MAHIDHTEFEAWTQLVHDRMTIIERALAAVIDDFEELLESAGGEPTADYPEESEGADGDWDLEEQETPEEEAARLRAEARAEFEAGNESSPQPSDPNDVVDVPEEGRSV
jgi:hypothetical protein